MRECQEAMISAQWHGISRLETLILESYWMSSLGFNFEEPQLWFWHISSRWRRLRTTIEPIVINNKAVSQLNSCFEVRTKWIQIKYSRAECRSNYSFNNLASIIELKNNFTKSTTWPYIQTIIMISLSTALLEHVPNLKLRKAFEIHLLLG